MVAERGLSLAQNATEILFGGSRADETLHRLDEEELRLIFGDAGFVQLAPEPGTTVLDMAMKARLFPSKGTGIDRALIPRSGIGSDEHARKQRLACTYPIFQFFQFMNCTSI